MIFQSFSASSDCITLKDHQLCQKIGKKWRKTLFNSFFMALTRLVSSFDLSLTLLKTLKKKIKACLFWKHSRPGNVLICPSICIAAWYLCCQCIELSQLSRTYSISQYRDLEILRIADSALIGNRKIANLFSNYPL